MRGTRLRSAAIASALIAGSVALAVLAVIGVDRIIGARAADLRIAAGLIFPPQVELAVKTYEFTYTIRTNNIGLRGDDFDLGRRPRVVVAAIGDSFTFGQGVAAADTWVQRIERHLRDKGTDVSILNFGQPGSSPQFYARMAEENLSYVKPDLVLVDFLQSDDLQQINLEEEVSADALRREPWLRARLHALFPALTDLAYREQAQFLAEREQRSNGNWNLMQTRWREDFKTLYDRFDDFDEGAVLNFSSMPDAVQAAFRDGGLHPIIAKRCATPFRLQMERELDYPAGAAELQPKIAAAAECLRRIQSAVAPWGGRVVVLCLPSMANNDPFGAADWYRILGVQVPKGAEDTRADDAIHAAAQLAGVPSHDVTAAFRAVAKTERLYYPLDSHMNARGNEVFSGLISPVIENYVVEK